MRMVHLNKSGSGMTSKTACGRNILRTPISINWEEFKKEPIEHRCAKCNESKQADVNRKSDTKKEEKEEVLQVISVYVPENSKRKIAEFAAKADATKEAK